MLLELYFKWDKHRWAQSEYFSLKSGTFSIYKKRASEVSPPICACLLCAQYIEEHTSGGRCSVSQQTYERWINVETTLIVNVDQRCFNFDIWLKMKIESTYIYRRCFNVVTTLKERRYNHVNSKSINQHCLNVKIWLIMKVEPTYIYRHCFNVDKKSLTQH